MNKLVWVIILKNAQVKVILSCVDDIDLDKFSLDSNYISTTCIKAQYLDNQLPKRWLNKN